MVVQHRSATPNDRQKETFSFINVSGPDLIMHQFAHRLPCHHFDSSLPIAIHHFRFLFDLILGGFSAAQP